MPSLWRQLDSMMYNVAIFLAILYLLIKDLLGGINMDYRAMHWRVFPFLVKAFAVAVFALFVISTLVKPGGFPDSCIRRGDWIICKDSTGEISSKHVFFEGRWIEFMPKPERVVDSCGIYGKP